MPQNTKDMTSKKSNIKKETAEPTTNTTKKVTKASSTSKKDTSKVTKKSSLSKSSKSVAESKVKKTTAVKSATAAKKQPSEKKATTKKVTKTKKAEAAKKSTVESKVAPKKATTKGSSSTKKATAKTTKKTSTKKTTTKKAASKKVTSKKIKTEVLEYYDLPYRYNQTVVKILAQTPNTLFVYWDISDSDRENYVKEFGENFFNDTFPILIVHNRTMNYSFEIEINDFANSWYFNINDSKCDYEIELGRRAKFNNISLPNNYMYVTSSNVIEAPNNHILFEKNQKVLFFRNVKTGNEYTKDISRFNFMRYIGRIYNIYDLYKKIYKDEELKDIEKNPSSTF